MMVSAAARVGSIWFESARTASTGFFCASSRDWTSYVFGSTTSATTASRIMVAKTDRNKSGRRRTEPRENKA